MKISIGHIIEAWKRGELTDGECAEMVLAARKLRLRDRRERARDFAR